MVLVALAFTSVLRGADSGAFVPETLVRAALALRLDGSGGRDSGGRPCSQRLRGERPRLRTDVAARRPPSPRPAGPPFPSGKLLLRRSRRHLNVEACRDVAVTRTRGKRARPPAQDRRQLRPDAIVGGAEAAEFDIGSKPATDDPVVTDCRSDFFRFQGAADQSLGGRRPLGCDRRPCVIVQEHETDRTIDLGRRRAPFAPSPSARMRMRRVDRANQPTKLDAV